MLACRTSAQYAQEFPTHTRERVSSKITRQNVVFHPTNTWLLEFLHKYARGTANRSYYRKLPLPRRFTEPWIREQAKRSSRRLSVWRLGRRLRKRLATGRGKERTRNLWSKDQKLKPTNFRQKNRKLNPPNFCKKLQKLSRAEQRGMSRHKKLVQGRICRPIRARLPEFLHKYARGLGGEPVKT